MTTPLHVFLFAGLADRIGSSSITMNIPQLPVSAGELKQLLSEAYPDAASLIAASFVAVNQEYAPADLLIHEGDEVALIPPVSGGDGLGDRAGASTMATEDGMCLITSESLSVEDTLSKVLHPDHGASLSFVGTTRELTGERRTVTLEYDAYIPMALKELDKIRQNIAMKWPPSLCAISHRIGTVGIGEISVVIAVSSPHRADCYEASRYAIEELKRTVPIWKREIWDDGSEWKGAQTGTWDPSN
ncbi:MULTISPECIES: molybdopterin converting factor subunit 1 [Paenibacillus]|uniref:Molybdopterin synthase catalytic subunit n=1 Tax=Paenibacillus campinasensis TaxID=66347 RepID=A0A268EJF7_9BACL|nr:molybdopterin converting factor subunit 1 [Paenibacillus campinasensis]MUG68682.1 molybdopterin converting factor subunit 1 [Paenibacillus campinasensis]PAD73268.1 molybdopterin converting factor subunit 1 [Paenibacillus campinasensis]